MALDQIYDPPKEKSMAEKAFSAAVPIYETQYVQSLNGLSEQTINPFDCQAFSANGGKDVAIYQVNDFSGSQGPLGKKSLKKMVIPGMTLQQFEKARTKMIKERHDPTSHNHGKTQFAVRAKLQNTL